MGYLFKKWVSANYLILLIILLYFLISVVKLEDPGVNNDQLMFVNAATLKEGNIFIWKSFHGIPMMVFPYIGALKSYLYMPIFYLFGVNIWSIRLPQIILISISLYLLYKTLSIAFNKQIGIFTCLFLALDPSLIAYSRVDNGPTVLEFLLKTLTIYLFYLYYKTKNGIFFISIYPVLALGIFNKINFFWFVNAFMISFIIFYIHNFYNNFKSHIRYFILSFIALILIPYYLLIRLFIKLSRETALSYKQFANEVEISNIFNHFSVFFSNLTEVIAGNLFFNTLYGYSPTPYGGYFISLIFLILVISLTVVVVKCRFNNQSFFRPFAFFISITILISLQILLTKRATSAWHILAVYPFFAIIFAASSLQFYKLIKSQKVKRFITVLIILVFFYQLILNFLYINKYSQPTKSIAWSSSIYDLVSFVKNTDTIFVCIDVDICHQLLALTQQRGKYREPFSFLDPDTYQKSFDNIKDYFENSEFLYIAHGPTTTHIVDFRGSFFNYLQDSKVNLKKIKEFKDGETVTFEIYKVDNQKQLQ